MAGVGDKRRGTSHCCQQRVRHETRAAPRHLLAPALGSAVPQESVCALSSEPFRYKINNRQETRKTSVTTTPASVLQKLQLH